MARLIATLLQALSHLVVGARAFTRFDPACTLPTIQVNFVSSPDSRGTLDILWSCLFTMIACTFTIQHLNIPKQRDHASEEKDRLHRILYAAKWEAKSFWTNLKWMLFTIIAPEYILGRAIGDFIFVRELKKRVDKMKTDGVIEAYEEWGLSHGFFSLIGGFRALEYDNSKEKGQTQRQESTPTGEIQDCKPEHMSIDLLGVTEGQDPHMTESKNIQGQIIQTSLECDVPGIAGPTILPPEILLWLRENRHISRLPKITEEEIHDKSKANVFVKVLAVVQIFWVCVQVIVRVTRGLAVSQLELMVTAFSICAIITYIFLIHKPQSVQVPMRPIRIPQGSLELSPPTRWLPLRNLFAPGIRAATDFNQGHVEMVPNDNTPGKEKDWGVYALCISAGGMIFGSIHIAGWNLSFPTPIERELWRIASLIMTCLLPVTFLPFILLIFYNHPWLYDTINQVWTFTFGAIYFIARLFLLVETFRALGFLPPDAFVDTWVSSIPNVS